MRLENIYDEAKNELSEEQFKKWFLESIGLLIEELGISEISLRNMKKLIEKYNK